MTRILRATACLTSLLLGGGVAFAGPGHIEMGDAGRLPPSAQRTNTGSGPLGFIAGSTPSPFGGGGDFEDMYEILIVDPIGFRASTHPDNGGSATFDTELWLFNHAGFGILGNDDDPTAPNGQSTIEAPANDGTGTVIMAPGFYYLAISGRNDDPTAAGIPIFNQATSTEISGPDGGVGAPIDDWNGTGSAAQGAYVIALQGVVFIEDRSIPNHGAWSMAAMALILCATSVFAIRRRNAVMAPV